MPRRSSVLRALVFASLLAACGREVPPPTKPAAPAPTLASAAVAPSAAPVASDTPPPPAEAAAFVPRRVSLEEKAMGTHVTLATFTTPELGAAPIEIALQKALAEIRRLESMMTTWRPDSELSLVNAAAGKEAIAVSPETLEVVEKALWIADKSEGVFDVTFEAMHGIWRFDEDRVDQVPSKEAIDKARKLIDWKSLRLDPKKGTLKLEKPGMRMSLGGIAKGYAVDVAARSLRASGIASFFVQAGGDLYVSGKKPDGSPYRVGVRDPRGRSPNDFFARIDVTDHAFSTAGDYERSFVQGDKRYHHIIDPRTGYPATASRSVTIWAKDALTADAIDDAVFILGPTKGLAIVEGIEDCGAVIVDKDNKVWVSKRLEGKLEILRPPTDGT